MQSLWNDAQAATIEREQGQLGLRVYTSRLLGSDPDLVLHGGGNTSLKEPRLDVFGDAIDTLYVKGSGWDLKTIEAAGFPPVDRAQLLRLGELDSLSDTQMMSELRRALLDPTAPTPSVEAILHALIPLRYVDHTHTDAVVTLSNSRGGRERLEAIFGDEVLILPYVMPGFVLAKQVAEATRRADWSRLRGIVLLNHGLFTFADDAKSSYGAMIELVTRAEEEVARCRGSKAANNAEQRVDVDPLALAALRSDAARLLGAPLLLSVSEASEAIEFACRDDAALLIASGPLTPDHTIHTKPFGACFGDDPRAGLEAFVGEYQHYFATHAGPEHSQLDPVPRFGVWKQRGVVHLAQSVKKLGVVEDIVAHTLSAMMLGERLGGWQPLARRELFDVEYWELEQAKLGSSPASSDPARELEGKIALVTGGASGIGYATVRRLLAAGAAVLVLDLDAAIESVFEADAAVLALRVDVTDPAAVGAALTAGVKRFGGLDIVISNAGIFPEPQSIESLAEAQWEASLSLNLSAQMRLLRSSIPYLKLGVDPSVVFIGSKNVPAPGRGAAAYSTAKAGLAQLARIAALELGEHGIRVNTLHPDAVYDTALWSEELLQARAAAYGLSVEAYKRRNVLGREVSSADVAEAALLLAGGRLAKTTGAQLPVDGGNERVL